MFDMFNGGKPDPKSLYIVNYEQRQSELNRVVNYIRNNYSVGDSIDVDEVTARLGISDLSDSEVEEVQYKLRR